MSTERQIGFYWILPDCRDLDWEIGYWDGKDWQICGQEAPFPRQLIYDVDPTPIVRNNKNEEQ